MKKSFNNFLCKISNGVKMLMKKLKKSEIAIYAIALMLVAAGYYNYVTFNKDTVQTSAEPVNNVTDNTLAEHTNVGDAVLVSNNEIQNTTDNTNTTNNTNQVEVSATDVTVDNTQTENQGNETVSTNSDETIDETNYFATTKLDRDKMYAEMVSNYEAILNNQNVSEAQKSIATEEITKINNTKNAIMICENLIITKGFENCVILINESSVNIVVSVQGGLDTQKVAQIQNIVSREIGTPIENIHISEK